MILSERFIKVKGQDVFGFINMFLVSPALSENRSDFLIFVGLNVWDIGRLHQFSQIFLSLKEMRIKYPHFEPNQFYFVSCFLSTFRITHQCLFKTYFYFMIFYCRSPVFQTYTPEYIFIIYYLNKQVIVLTWPFTIDDFVCKKIKCFVLRCCNCC